MRVYIRQVEYTTWMDGYIYEYKQTPALAQCRFVVVFAAAPVYVCVCAVQCVRCDDCDSARER